jgi:hypothetical protein
MARMVTIRHVGFKSGDAFGKAIVAIDIRLSVLEGRWAQALGHLATKADVAELKAELKADIHKATNELHKATNDILKWMVATVIGMFFGISGLFVAVTGSLKATQEASIAALASAAGAGGHPAAARTLGPGGSTAGRSSGP